LFSIPLIPVSWLYGLIIYLRNLLYDSGIFKIYRASVPVISVGNITVGGTGKTPFVEYLLRFYEKKGFKDQAKEIRDYKNELN
jgi:tetraacyldisaccharide 4'-kinase